MCRPILQTPKQEKDANEQPREDAGLRGGSRIIKPSANVQGRNKVTLKT